MVEPFPTHFNMYGRNLRALIHIDKVKPSGSHRNTNFVSTKNTSMKRIPQLRTTFSF